MPQKASKPVRYFLKSFVAVTSLVIVSGCSFLTALPENMSTQQRLAQMAQLPAMPLQQKVRVYWNDHLIPFIEAEDDRDAAFMLGIIQAHLRLTQMELGKYIAYGRLSEIAGPMANDIDVALRAVDFPRAAPKIIRRMPVESKAWLQNFVKGINFYKSHMPELPHGMAFLGLKNDPWQIEDTLALGRLSGIDVNWLIALSLLPLMETGQWPELWRRIQISQQSKYPSFFNELAQKITPKSKNDPGAGSQYALLWQLLSGYMRSGSNSVAVAKWRSQNGGAMIASDPHLGFLIPNLWMIAGLKSPCQHIVGMIPVGLPVFGFGRNAHLAWGGTNMRQAATDFVDVTDIQDQLIQKTHNIKTRFWLDHQGTYRFHPRYGPVISDLAALKLSSPKAIALRWTGHLPSDEISALLKMAQARTWQELRQATTSFSVPGQNYIFATNQGDIGQILASWLPDRPMAYPTEFLIKPAQSDQYWQKIKTSENLPFNLNPQTGVIGSANNKPVDRATTLLGWFYPVDDRIKRIYELLSHPAKISLDDLKQLQMDSFSLSHKNLNDFLIKEMAKMPETPQQRQILTKLRGWNGKFDQNSVKAYLHHYLFLKIKDKLYGGEVPLIPVNMSIFDSNGQLPAFIQQDFQNLTSDQQQLVLTDIIDQMQPYLQDPHTWGDIHQIDIQHVFGNISYLGRSYRFGRLPVDGHQASLFKTAGQLEGDHHQIRYGSQARHISDMADRNQNLFILYGGQDGQINSRNALDQIPLWQKGDYIRLPLDLDLVRQEFKFQQVFDPEKMAGN